MNRLIALLMVLSGIMCHAQADRITFSYDTAGNQIIRQICFGCTTMRIKNSPPKEITALEEDDLQKFSSNDIISYYPNPVKEELYLKWEVLNDNYVSTIKVYDFNGRVLKSFSNLKSTTNQNIAFQNYSTGAYAVVLMYQNGEQKTIKIIKQ